MTETDKIGSFFIFNQENLRHDDAEPIKSILDLLHLFPDSYQSLFLCQVKQNAGSICLEGLVSILSSNLSKVSNFSCNKTHGSNKVSNDTYENSWTTTRSSVTGLIGCGPEDDPNTVCNQGFQRSFSWR